MVSRLCDVNVRGNDVTKKTIDYVSPGSGSHMCKWPASDMEKK